METSTEPQQTINKLSTVSSLSIWIWINVLIVSFFLVVACSNSTVINSPSSNSDEKFPNDAEMQTIFDKKRHLFDKLIEMSNEDSKVIWITYDYTEVLDASRSGEMGKDRPIGFSVKRWEEYKQLFREIELKTGIARLGAESRIYTEGVYLIAFSKGMLGGVEKGYVYTKKQINEELLVDSLDQVLKDIDKKNLPIKEKSAIFYKKIAEDWYIYIAID